MGITNIKMFVSQVLLHTSGILLSSKGMIEVKVDSGVVLTTNIISIFNIISMYIISIFNYQYKDCY